MLYGVTKNGGGTNTGVLYKFDPISKNQVVVHHFNNANNGYFPSTELVESNGFLYGCTSAGGQHNKGVLFKYDPQNNLFFKLYDFGINNNAAALPVGKIIISNDILYGTSNEGGQNGNGTIYMYNLVSSTFAIVHDFDNNTSGSGAKTGLQLSGIFAFGMAETGGENGNGTIYKFNTTNNSFDSALSFDASLNGSNPTSIIEVVTGSGFFYGVTSNGGTNGIGNIFSFDSGSNTINNLYDINDGSHPKGGLFYDNGLLFGTTSEGGVHGNGTAFKYNTTSGIYTTIIDLNSSTEGANPSFTGFVTIQETGAELLSGPHAPDVSILSLENELVLNITNGASSNNINEAYAEVDMSIPSGQDSLFRFQGYQVFQVLTSNITTEQLLDPAYSRLIAQIDINDSISGTITNMEYNPVTNLVEPVIKINAFNNGIQHSIHITTDLFSNSTVINGQEYYYITVAFAYNWYRNQYPSANGETYGYLESSTLFDGTKIKPIVGIPDLQNPSPNVSYGQGVEITRIEGQGNGGLILNFTPDTETDIINNYYMDKPSYQIGSGPIDIKVIDPVLIPEADFSITFFEDGAATLDSASWELEVLTSALDGYGNSIAAGTIYSSDQTIASNNEQIIPELGLSVSIKQSEYIAQGANRFTYPLESSIAFEDPNSPWLTGISDQDNFTPFNWIRSGTQEEANPPNWIYNDYLSIDDNQYYENILGGTWSPWRLITRETGGPVGLNFSNTITMPDIADVHSVDIVFTSDTSDWTRCAVIEMQEDPILSQGGVAKSSLRESPSVNKLGDPDNTGTGMGWFPGYALDLETGERLNMAFGEDSYQVAENGRDMIWNPTSTIVDPVITGDTSYRFAGKHYIFVFNNDARLTGDNTRMPLYDEGVYLETRLNGSNGDKIRVWRSTMWVGLPALIQNETLLSSDVKVSLRVDKPYEPYTTTLPQVNSSNPKYKFSTLGYGSIDVTEIFEINEDIDLIRIYPNPNDGNFVIDNISNNSEVTVYTLEGKEISHYSNVGSSLKIKLNQNAGMYLLRVQNNVSDRVYRIVLK